MSFLHYIVGNGLANIYIHNWIRMDPLLIPFKKPLQHVSTLCRQLMFDLVFISENIILLGIGKQVNLGSVYDIHTKVQASMEGRLKILYSLIYKYLLLQL